ncbi:MAG: hypothetical protein A2076_13550 [Geobacteraceae bacterium GWC2_53_11]|nr:MAG: hypothetical protein A2076_13550 [Geobacteraceae bacterium GWC2_53_11]
MLKRSRNSLLYIEDDAIVRDIICSFIAARYPAMSIDSSGSAHEGLELFRKQRHAIVLTDVHLNDSDGVSMARAIRKKDPETVIVFITGSSDVEPLADFKKTGPSHVLIKPVECDVLFEVLDTYLKADPVS